MWLAMRHDATTVSCLPVVLEPRREGIVRREHWLEKDNKRGMK
jgi:hypothetical protein